MSEHIVVRTAEPADVPRIAELYRAWWDEINGGPHAHPGPVRMADEGEGHPDWCMGQVAWIDVDVEELAHRLNPLFVVAAGPDACGFLYAFEGRVQQERFQAFRAGGRYVEIADLYVEKARRGGAVGTALLEEVLRRAEADGVEQFHVVSAPTDDLDRFYAKAGFRAYSVFRYRGGGYESPHGHQG